MKEKKKMVATTTIAGGSLRLQPVDMNVGATMDIGSAPGDLILANGSGAVITSLGTAPLGAIKWMRFLNDGNTIKQGPTIKLPGGVDFVAQADDVIGFAVFQTVWRCISVVT